jgi:Leucine-rich repeat (LRR) protein
VFRNFEFTDLTTGPAPKAVSPPADPDRAVAAWALEYGGRVTLQVGGTVTTLVGKKGGVDLPAEPFRVLKLYFMYPEAIPVDKLAQLQSLPRLESLAFYLNNRWSGDFTPHLAALTNLKSLQVSGTKPQHLTTLEFLRNFANLEELILGSRSNFGDEALAPIADLKKLRILDLRHCPISDVGLVHLRDLPQLTELDLSLTKISDEGLRQLNPKLTNLGLRWTAITDAGLAQLAQRLPNLTHLQLVKTPITDAGLQHLGKLSKLTGLHLGETKVTAEGVKKLQADLPKCKVNTTETEPDPEPQPED